MTQGPLLPIPAAKVEHALVPFLALYEASAYFFDSLPILIAAFFNPAFGVEFLYQYQCQLLCLLLSEINGIFGLLKRIPVLVSYLL